MSQADDLKGSVQYCAECQRPRAMLAAPSGVPICTVCGAAFALTSNPLEETWLALRQELHALAEEIEKVEELSQELAIGQACSAIDALLVEADEWDAIAARCGNPIAAFSVAE